MPKVRSRTAGTTVVVRRRPPDFFFTTNVRSSWSTSISAISAPRRRVVTYAGPPCEQGTAEDGGRGDGRAELQPRRQPERVVDSQQVETGIPVHEGDREQEGEALGELLGIDGQRVLGDGVASVGE